VLSEAGALFEAEKYWDAIQRLEPVVRRAEGATRSSAMLLLAQAYLKNPLWQRRAEGVLQALVGHDPRHVEAHLLLAEVYLSNRLPARAASMYRKVLEIQPANREARRALAHLEASEEAAPPTMMGRLFKKR
jgi:cytochrome c-type biogenesis protein CcmH/NrfG